MEQERSDDFSILDPVARDGFRDVFEVVLGFVGD